MSGQVAHHADPLDRVNCLGHYESLALRESG